MKRRLCGYFLGRRAYLPTLEFMQSLFDARRAGAIGDTVLLLEHEPVITLGRGAKDEHLLWGPDQLQKLGVGVVATGRGGDITLHAPGQLVVYPVVDLSPDRQDVRKYVKALTEVMRRIVSNHGIDSGPIDAMIGLWTDTANTKNWPGQAAAQAPAKLGAIGVRISRWVTQHGFALNLTTDLSLYDWIVPCGISNYPVASVKSLSGAEPDLQREAQHALTELGDLLSADTPAMHDCTGLPLTEVMAIAQRLHRSG